MVIVLAFAAAILVLGIGWVGVATFLHARDLEEASAGDFLLDREAKR